MQKLPLKVKREKLKLKKVYQSVVAWHYYYVKFDEQGRAIPNCS